jgi:far upstream element-binding protein
LQENSGAKIIIRGRGSQKDGAVSSGHADDDDELHISIEGTDESIEKAFKEIEPLLFNPEEALKLKQEQLKNLAEMNGSVPSSSGFGAISDSIYGGGNKVMSSVISSGDDYQVELKVPNAMVGFVIGKGGEHIQKLQSQTGAHVQIAREQDMKPGDTHRSIVLKGNPDAVAECKRMIDEVIISRQQSSVSSFGQPKQHTQREMDHSFIVKVKVPNNKVGIIIGKGGATIKTIQERTGAQVQIPSVPDEDNPNLRTLCIGGDSLESVEAAQQEITVALQQSAQVAGAPLGGGGSLYPAMQMPQTSTSFVLVPDDRVGVIIGKAGATIKELQSRTRVKISIPQAADVGSNPPVRTCRCAGVKTILLFIYFLSYSSQSFI